MADDVKTIRCDECRTKLAIPNGRSGAWFFPRSYPLGYVICLGCGAIYEVTANGEGDSYYRIIGNEKDGIEIDFTPCDILRRMI